MHRMAIMEKALANLNLLGASSEKEGENKRIDTKLLIALMPYIRHIIWPTVTNCPPIPPHIDSYHRFEWILNHISEILGSQVMSAFRMHGDVRAVAPCNEFKPAPPFSAKGDEVTMMADFGEDPKVVEMCRNKTEAILQEFISNRLPLIRNLLNQDVQIALEKDPAASSVAEVIHTYPGVRCMLYYRVAHQLHLLGVPTSLTRCLTEIAHSVTGIDIHPHTQVGHHLFIDHGTGIVIGGSAIIGNYVSIYQGVTLGALSFKKDKTGKTVKNLPRHPIIEDYVTLYANAVVLGRVTIGRNSVIGGNVWVVTDVPANSKVAQRPSRVLKHTQEMFPYQSDGSGI